MDISANILVLFHSNNQLFSVSIEKGSDHHNFKIGILADNVK